MSKDVFQTVKNFRLGPPFPFPRKRPSEAKTIRGRAHRSESLFRWRKEASSRRPRRNNWTAGDKKRPRKSPVEYSFDEGEERRPWETSPPPPPPTPTTPLTLGFETATKQTGKCVHDSAAAKSRVPVLFSFQSAPSCQIASAASRPSALLFSPRRLFFFGGDKITDCDRRLWDSARNRAPGLTRQSRRVYLGKRRGVRALRTSSFGLSNETLLRRDAPLDKSLRAFLQMPEKVFDWLAAFDGAFFGFAFFSNLSDDQLRR